MSTRTKLKDLDSNTREENRLISGTLVVSTVHRDLRWALNGDDALVIMRNFAKDGASGWEDPVDPFTSEAMYGWLTWDNTSVVSMRWAPDWDTTVDRLHQVVTGGGSETSAAARLLRKLLGARTTPDRDPARGPSSEDLRIRDEPDAAPMAPQPTDDEPTPAQASDEPLSDPGHDDTEPSE